MQKELLYLLDVKVPDQSPRKLEVKDHVLAGLDPRNDLILIDPKIEARHFLFKNKDGLLTVLYLGADNTTFLNNLPLEKEKLYILEEGDTLKCGRVEIKIRQELIPVRPKTEGKIPTGKTTELRQEKKLRIPPPAVFKPVSKTPVIAPGPMAPQKAPKERKKNFERVLALKKIPFKFYGFVVDVAITYFILAFVIPYSGFLDRVQSLLFPMTEFFNTILIEKHPELIQWKVLSLLEFFISFHLIMITSGLILGNTPGAFMIGLHPVKKSFLGNRFKAYLYALLNVFALPFIIFDLPLFKGRTTKEWITFFNREMKLKAPFRILQTAFVPSFLVIFFLAPLFLKHPFSAIVKEEKLTGPKFKDVHTQFMTSESSTFGVSLKSELDSQFAVLPFFEPNKKTGLTLYDHESGKALVMKEEWRLKTDFALYKLRFSNPISSLYLPNELISNELLKTKAFWALITSPVTFVQGINHFGLFLGNGILFKEQFLKNFSKAESYLVMTFNEKNPFLLLSSSSEEMLFWFSRNEIIAFRLTVPKQTKLWDHFTRDILAGMRFNQGQGDKLKTPQILEALDAFERENYQTLLTYYILEAKKAGDPKTKNSSGWRSFLKNNILQTKTALSGAQNKNIEKSFDDVMSTL